MVTDRSSWLLFPAVFACSACASTAMISRPTPAAAGHSLGTVLVIANLSDPATSRAAELRFVAAGAGDRDHTRFIASQTVLVPGRRYDQAERATILRRDGVDGTLVLSLAERGSDVDEVSPTYGVMPCGVWTAELGCQDVPMLTSAGYRSSAPWARFNARLYDANSGRLLWSASSQTRGTSYADLGTLVHSMTSKTLKRLVHDRIVR
jgi:hypothetical protein